MTAPPVPGRRQAEDHAAGVQGVRQFLSREFRHANDESARSARMVEILGRGVDLFWADMNRIAAANPNNYDTRADYIQARTLYERAVSGQTAWRQRQERIDIYIGRLMLLMQQFGFGFC